MSVAFIISTVFEFLLGGFIIWGIFNEQKLVAFEERMFLRIKNYFKDRSKQFCLKARPQDTL